VSVGRHEVRIFYAFFPGQRIVLLHGFLKKTRTIPTRELEIAHGRGGYVTKARPHTDKK